MGEKIQRIKVNSDGTITESQLDFEIISYDNFTQSQGLDYVRDDIKPSLLNIYANIGYQTTTLNESFEMNRYFGLYVDELEEGTVSVDLQRTFYNSYDKSQEINPSVFKSFKKDYIITNNNGVILNYDNLNTVTDVPNKKDNENLASFFYLKDKKENFHSIDVNNSIKDTIRLKDDNVTLNDYIGYTDVLHSIKVKDLDNNSPAHLVISIKDRIKHGAVINFYDQDNNFIEEITADETLTINGEPNQLFFNPKGTNAQVAKSLAGAINNIIKEIMKSNTYHNFFC